MNTSQTKSRTSRLAILALCCVAAFGTTVANSIVPANAVGVQYNYYEDYFYSQGTCISR